MPNIFAITLDTESLLAGNIPVGTLSLEETCEVLFSDRYFDKLYLDDNTTTTSFSGNTFPLITATFVCGAESTSEYTALFGNTGSLYLTQESSSSFFGSIGIFGSVTITLDTAVLFENNITTGYLSFSSDTDSSFGAYLGITGSFVFEQPTIASIYGYFSSTSTDIGSLSSAIKTHCMNLNTQGMSQYTNYNFNSFFMVGGKYYGCSTDGTFLLSGDLDNATTIAQSVVQTATSDFNTQKLKGARDVYAYVRSTGDMLVTVTTNEQIERGNYPLYYDNIDGIHRRRVKIAQGIKGTSWGVIVKNDSGADFTIKQADIIPIELDRSV